LPSFPSPLLLIDSIASQELPIAVKKKNGEKKIGFHISEENPSLSFIHQLKETHDHTSK
jgi:predicted FMN-binding regulatory protein PaiB